MAELCAYGLRDPVSKKYFKQSSALEVNNPMLCSLLPWKRRCTHQPDERPPVEGKVMPAEGIEIPRSHLVARWPEEWFQEILAKSAETFQMQVQPTVHDALHSEADPRVHQMGELSGQKCDYVYFEGTSASLGKN